MTKILAIVSASPRAKRTPDNPRKEAFQGFDIWTAAISILFFLNKERAVLLIVLCYTENL